MKMPENQEGQQILLQCAEIMAEVLMVVGGAIPFIPQYLEIARTGETAGFSMLTSMTIVVAALLRISYWFRQPFDNVLFAQCIFMVFVMFVMIELCVRIDRKMGRYRTEHTFLELEPAFFWAWTDLLSYIEASLFILTAAVFVVLFLGHVPGVIDGVGYLAMLLEASVALPIFINNIQNGTTHGLNKAMVCMWGLGDILRLAFFIMRDVPLSFLICSYFQITLDVLILAQIFIYGDHPKQE